LAEMSGPVGLVVSPQGDLFISDSQNSRIRAIRH
jgi:NHL repeat